jgi:hypothetical protein
MAETWRRCSACKSDIECGATYWVCSVSTCNRVRTALAFCSVSCWEVHLPGAHHRESWAVEKTAPSAADARNAEAGEARAKPGAARERPRRRIVSATPAAASPRATEPEPVLLIASRLKDYIRQTTGLSTSDRVLEPLSDIVRKLCDEAARNAVRAGRRTVLDRDVPKP